MSSTYQEQLERGATIDRYGPEEYILLLRESTVRAALEDPLGYGRVLVRGALYLPRSPVPFRPNETPRGWITQSGETYFGTEAYPTSLLIKFPGFIGRAVARARYEEPIVKIHGTINKSRAH